MKKRPTSQTHQGLYPRPGLGVFCGDQGQVDRLLTSDIAFKRLFKGYFLKQSLAQCSLHIKGAQAKVHHFMKNNEGKTASQICFNRILSGLAQQKTQKYQLFALKNFANKTTSVKFGYKEEKSPAVAVI